MLPKLTQDQFDSLQDLLLNHDGVKALLHLLESEVTGVEQALIRYTLEGGDAARFLHQKAQAEGARKVYKLFITSLENIKANSLKEKTNAPGKRRK